MKIVILYNSHYLQIKSKLYVNNCYYMINNDYITNNLSISFWYKRRLILINFPTDSLSRRLFRGDVCRCVYVW